MTYNYLLGLWGKKKGGGLAIDVSSEPVFLSKKRRISTDVSSGLISLTHTKKRKQSKSPLTAEWKNKKMCSLQAVAYYIM